MHAIGVTKRLIAGLFVPPAGWPEGSPVIASSISSYRVLWPCHSRLTPRYRSYVKAAAQSKRVFHLRSRREQKRFLEDLKAELNATRGAAGGAVRQAHGAGSSNLTG